jgi:hypothetical protein
MGDIFTEQSGGVKFAEQQQPSNASLTDTAFIGMMCAWHHSGK